MSSVQLAIVIADNAAARESMVAGLVREWGSTRPNSVTIDAPDARAWPFTWPLAMEWPAEPFVLRMADVHEAFVNHQTGATRLVTTQASYVMQAWLDAAGSRDGLLLALADRASITAHAPEILQRRGPFAAASIPLDAAPSGESGHDGSHHEVPTLAGPEGLLAEAFRAGDPAERLQLCVRALEHGRTPAALVATASACMEANDLDAAARDLDEALHAAPDWAAAHFERGKLWLRLDDMQRASEAFRAAADRMPAFASAWANLGATLGELDRPREALSAFEHARRADPASHQALNNIGVVNRELGNLAASEAAFRQVIELAPDLAFGHYNLGHTLFLQGRYQAALSAYVEGQQRDPERNPVQASRLAMCRLAAGDGAGALADLQRATTGLPREYRRQLLADTSAIAWALFTHRPDLPGWKPVNDWLTAELTREAGRH